jgi:hypothetical protein
MSLSVGGTLRVYAAICGALGILPLANWLTSGRAVPWYGLAVREWLGRGVIVLAVATVIAILLGARFDAFWERARASLLRIPSNAFAFAIAALATVGALILAHWSFAGLPFTSDEMAQQWHARILVSGRVSAVAEQYPEFFNTAPVFDRDGSWYSQYPLGGPAFMALGVDRESAVAGNRDLDALSVPR